MASINVSKSQISNILTELGNTISSMPNIQTYSTKYYDKLNKIINNPDPEKINESLIFIEEFSIALHNEMLEAIGQNIEKIISIQSQKTMLQHALDHLEIPITNLTQGIMALQDIQRLPHLNDQQENLLNQANALLNITDEAIRIQDAAYGHKLSLTDNKNEPISVKDKVLNRTKSRNSMHFSNKNQETTQSPNNKANKPKKGPPKSRS